MSRVQLCTKLQAGQEFLGGLEARKRYLFWGEGASVDSLGSLNTLINNSIKGPPRGPRMYVLRGTPESSGLEILILMIIMKN